MTLYNKLQDCDEETVTLYRAAKKVEDLLWTLAASGCEDEYVDAFLRGVDSNLLSDAIRAFEKSRMISL